ncbi:putative acyl-activating enzyme 5, peroxisomal [Platanthera guangdongensis]|uniref:Acyl-activating enzyme 5, peroxisomal n=1 Tax=Platanthera guangdongensis TaxID=2320717 RepID=A0ABR2MYY9_9ASPA
MDVVSGEMGRGVPWDDVTMGEYLKDEETMAKTIKDGWFFTGDVGVMHCDSYLEIKDRSKDVIISGGENISNVEVESLMYGHPTVNEEAVVARPDDFGETACAFVGMRAGLAGPPPTEAEVIAWCREKMPHFIVRKTVVFLPELPKTSPGKIHEYVLRNTTKKLGR